MLIDLCPPARGRSLSWLLLPNQHLPVIRTRSEYMPEFWMSPGYLPDRSCMPIGAFKRRETNRGTGQRTLSRFGLSASSHPPPRRTLSQFCRMSTSQVVYHNNLVGHHAVPNKTRITFRSKRLNVRSCPHERFPLARNQRQLQLPMLYSDAFRCLDTLRLTMLGFCCEERAEKVNIWQMRY